MKKEITAEYMHQLLKSQLFSDVDLDAIPSMTDEELRAMTVAQADAIMGLRRGGDAMGWLIGQFLEDEGSWRDDNPLNHEKSPLTDWYRQLVEFCTDLYYHHSFDLDELAPGLAQDHDECFEDFTLANKPLVAWLRETPYRRVAVMVAKIMLNLEFAHVVGKNDAIQDYYAENCDRNSLDVQNTDECNELTNTILHCLETIDQHRQRGRELGLDDEQMRVVDALWGWAPHDYETEFVEAAKEVVKAVNASLPAKTVIRSRNGFVVYKQQVIPTLTAIAEKYELGIDLTDQYNLTMGYLTEWLYRKYMGDLIDDEFFDE